MEVFHQTITDLNGKDARFEGAKNLMNVLAETSAGFVFNLEDDTPVRVFVLSATKQDQKVFYLFRSHKDGVDEKKFLRKIKFNSDYATSFEESGSVAYLMDRSDEANFLKDLMSFYKRSHFFDFTPEKELRMFRKPAQPIKRIYLHPVTFSLLARKLRFNEIRGRRAMSLS
jgi:hypothetical protein